MELLNRNEVDISSSPLDSYGDGEDMEEDAGDGEDEDGDDELEEIEEEVFYLSQPNNLKSKKRITNYTEIEDTCLVLAWSSVTIDLVTGSDQTDKRYWQCIEDMFLQAHASS
jgi:hypothetical protein